MRLKITKEAAEIVRRFAEENDLSYYNDATSELILLFDKIRAPGQGVLKLADHRAKMGVVHTPTL